MLIVGTGGYAKELLHVWYNNNPNVPLAFYDAVTPGLPNLFFDRYPILTTPQQVTDHLANNPAFALGIGKPWLRYQLAQQLIGWGGVLTSVVSGHAIIGHFDNVIGAGTTIMDQVVIETSNRIGEGCLLHKGAFISHDVSIGNFCEISPAANLLGKVSIGHGCSIGTGATILPGIALGNNVVVGAGAVVSKPVSNHNLVVGVPAKQVKSLEPLEYTALNT
jgi:sugar O-acyltransferase (sialic acid O-acetyltransferase NeuD family)